MQCDIAEPVSNVRVHTRISYGNNYPGVIHVVNLSHGYPERGKSGTAVVFLLPVQAK